MEHRTRVSVVLRDGERLVGESGGDQGDLSAPKTDAEVAEKFLGLSADFFGADRARAILARLWNLPELADMAQIPRDFVRP